MPHQKAKTELLGRLREIRNLHQAAAVLIWDQETYMPSGGSAARGRQLATLRKLAHEKFIEARTGHLLDALVDRPSDDPDDAYLLRLVRRQYEQAINVPASFTATRAVHTTEAYQVWTQARPANDFEMVRPYLEKTLDLSRQYANFFPGYDHIADPLIDLSDHGMSVSTTRSVFADLRDQLVPLVRAIGEKPPIDNRCLQQYYPEKTQWDWGEDVIRDFGYDFKRGRQDKTHHPFMIKFSLGDVRITTRVDEHRLDEYLFSTLHESGHALYEQGISQRYEESPLGGGTSSGVHESQSRLWENLVGRSKRFWQHYYPQLQAIFPTQLGDVSLETFYQSINKVDRSLIRVDADEVTYNLHVIIRFELELELLEGTLAVADLADAWRARYEDALGIVSPDDKDGVLQDVHWYGGLIGGAFQGYALGNIMSAQFYDAAVEARPQITSEIGQGQFGTLHTWLQDNIYQHGSKFTTAELLMQATGRPLTLEPYMNYLQTKYGEIYSL